jgi:hypothetical protein
VTVDGVMANVTLAAGSYTPTQLATALQTAINTNTTLQQAGVSVNVTQNASGELNVTSTSYGSQSSVSIGGTGATQLFGSTQTTTTCEPVGKRAKIAGFDLMTTTKATTPRSACTSSETIAGVSRPKLVLSILT